jgi:hypothetical protein
MSLLILAGMLGMICTALVAVFYGTVRMRQNFSGTSKHESEYFAYTFQTPSARYWRPEPSLRAGLDANAIQLTRNNPTAWFALGARDTKGRPTSEAELMQEAMRRLRDYFQRMESEPKDDVTLAGQTAKRLVFIGEDREVPVAGEMLAVTHNGFDYWFFFYAPRDDYEKAKPEFDDIKQRFAFIQRKKEADKSAVKAFLGTGYSLEDTEGRWEKFPDNTPATDFDDNGDLALRGRDPLAKKESWRGAQALVLLIPSGGDPLATAADYVLAAEKKNYPMAKLEPETLNADGTMGDANDGEVGAYKLILSDNLTKFVVIGAANLGDKIVVIRCECRGDQRTAWEKEFARLVNSFRGS